MVLDSDSDGNTIGGTNAGDSITTGTNNTTIGKDGWYCNYNWILKCSIGQVSLLDANTTGDLNVAIGLQAQTVSTTAGENTSVGAAGRYIGAGQYNTAIGRSFT